MDRRFVEYEPPASPGEPVYKEMPLHFGDAWAVCFARVGRALGDAWVEVLEALGLIHQKAAGDPPGPCDEFEEDVMPVPGLPDFREYGLPPLCPPADA